MSSDGLGKNSKPVLPTGMKYYYLVLKFLLCTLAGTLIFFVPMEVGGYEKNILFGTIVKFLVNTLGNLWFWIIIIIISVNVLLFFASKTFLNKDGPIKRMYENDSMVHGALYILGAIYALMYAFKIGPEWVIGPATAGVAIGAIVVPIGWMISLGGMFVVFFIAFGGLQFVGTLLQPIMRSLFKIPGNAALDATASFVGATSVGVLVTRRLYRENVYTQKEAVSIATGFCVVSIGFAALVADVVGLLPMFPVIMLTTFIITLIVAAIMIRIPPISRKPDMYYNGKPQTDEDRMGDYKFSPSIFKNAFESAIDRVAVSDNVFVELFRGFMDGVRLTPKILGLVTAVGLTGLIFAEYTPLFKWISTPMIPILTLLAIPDAALIAPSTIVGITEMYLPALLISNLDVSAAARYFIVVLSLVQIVFFAETAIVILVTGIPVTAKELVIIFFERTFIAMPFIAIFMHILF